MNIRLSASYVVAFTLLLLIMMETHEIVHISVGRLLCGCWGTRDFNVWSLCEGCQESQPLWWLATLAGPVFSFMVMWWGMFWLRSPDRQKQALGFAFIFCNIPFGRITTVMMGGGDEMVVLRHLLRGYVSLQQTIWIGSVLLLLLGVPPIINAYKYLTNKRKWLYIAGFLTLPLLFLLLYLLTGMNTLLTHGFLVEPWIMGTPLFITLHTLIAALLLFWLRKNLFLINQS